MPLTPTTTPLRPRTVAIVLWIISSVELILFTCCGMVLAMISLLPAEELTQALSEEMSADQMEQVMAMKPEFVVIAGVQAVVMVLPALALVVLAFGVMRSKRYAITGSRVIVAGHALLVGLLLVLGVSNSVSMGDVSSLLLYAFLFGGLLAALIYAFVLLTRLGHQGESAPEH